MTAAKSVDALVSLSLRRHVLLSSMSLWLPNSSSGVVVDKSPLNEEAISSLIYQNVLGSGAYKTVYLVSTSFENQSYYALAVSRLRERVVVKDGVRGIQVVQELQGLLVKNGVYFEQVYDWWFQDSSPAEFQPGKFVFATNHVERTHKVPSRFVGLKWLIAVKPVYDLDLESFCNKAPTLYPVGSNLPQSCIALLPLNHPNAAVRLVLELLHAGSVMHSVNLIHRDLKPKNIMLWNASPVIIDFGFAAFVNSPASCIEQPGRIKGQLDYVLAKDVANYRGCKQGDVYAMGKTLFELLYGEAQDASSRKQEITVEAAQEENAMFRALLGDKTKLKSRFQLDKTTSDALFNTICGLCREEDPLTLIEAESFLRDALGEVK